MRQAVTHGCYLRPSSTRAQLEYLVQRLQLCEEIAPFTRCTLCNGMLVELDAARVRSEVPAAVAQRHTQFWNCLGCGRVYWQGTHWEAMRRQIDAICPAAE
jgi:uncharacterized protein with PIN domain